MKCSDPGKLPGLGEFASLETLVGDVSENTGDLVHGELDQFITDVVPSHGGGVGHPLNAVDNINGSNRACYRRSRQTSQQSSQDQ